MTRAPTTDLDVAFAALSDATRRAVIQALLKRPTRASELAAATGMSAPALSRHLRVLRNAGLIVERGLDSDGRVRMYSVEPAALAPVRDWLAQAEDLWHEQLAAFKAHAENAGRRRKPSS